MLVEFSRFAHLRNGRLSWLFLFCLVVCSVASLLQRYWSVVTITTVGYGDLNIDKKTDRVRANCASCADNPTDLHLLLPPFLAVTIISLHILLVRCHPTTPHAQGFASFYILISVFLMARNLGLVSQVQCASALGSALVR